MYDIAFYEGQVFQSKYLGCAMTGNKRVHAEYQPPYSHAWFCPECGNLWAKSIVKKAYTDDTQKYTIEGGYCELHPGPSPYHVPGTMLLAWDEEFNQLLLSCPDAVKREFALHMKFYERSFTNG